MVRGSGLGERLGRSAFRAAAFLGLSLVLLPLVLVCWLSFFSNEILSLPPEGYSLRWYEAALGQPQWLFSGSGVLGDRGEAGGFEGPLME